MRHVDRMRLWAVLVSLGSVLMAGAARAQVVVPDGATVTVPPDINDQVSLGDGSTLDVRSRGAVTNADIAVIDINAGTTIFVTNLGMITSTAADAIDAADSTLFTSNGGTGLGG